MRVKEFIDISPIISEGIGVFPGDMAFKRSVSLDFQRGDNLVLSSIQTTLHLGAHADAPSHYSPQGHCIEERSLALYMGKCLVLHSLPGPGRVTRERLSGQWRTSSQWPAPRILVRTDTFPDPNVWNHEFSSLDAELLNAWGNSGVRLVGIDTPSVDPETSVALETHQVLAKHDMAVLEGLVLNQVSEGLYSLLALPLRIKGADASPVRAVLFRDSTLFD
jgi:arylformamidase